MASIPTDQEGTHMVAVTSDGRIAFTANIRQRDGLGRGPEAREEDCATSPSAASPKALRFRKKSRCFGSPTLREPAFRPSTPKAWTRSAKSRPGPCPIRVAASPDGRWIVTSNVGDGSLTLIDAASRKKVRDVPVAGTQEAGQVTILFGPDGSLYAAETGRNTVAEIDLVIRQGSAPASRRNERRRPGDRTHARNVSRLTPFRKSRPKSSSTAFAVSLRRGMSGGSGAAAFAGALVARRAEFAVRGPVRPVARIGEPVADVVQQLPVLDHAGQVPVRIIFVVRLVIALGRIFVLQRLAARRAAFDESLPGTPGNGRNAEPWRRGSGPSGRSCPLSTRGSGVKLRPWRLPSAISMSSRSSLAVPEMLKSARRAVDRAAVRVEDAGGLAERIERVRRIIFRTEQALFLGRDGEEDDRAVGPRLLGEGARLLDQVRGAGRIVERAIVDAVAVRVGQPDAEMIVVRGVDHRLVGTRLARQDARRRCSDVITSVLRVDLGVERRLEVDRPEVACASPPASPASKSSPARRNSWTARRAGSSFRTACARRPGSGGRCRTW